MSQPILICGLGRVGFRIVDYLRAANIPVKVISLKDSSDERLAGIDYISGDCTRPELLERAGIRTARGVVIVTSDDLVNVSTALLVRQMNPDVRIVVRMFNQNLLPRLGAAVKNTVALSVSALTAPLLALTALTGDTLGAFSLDQQPHQLAEITVAYGSPLVGIRLPDAARKHHLLILSHARKNSFPVLWSHLNDERIIESGDRIVACGQPDHLAVILSREDEPSLSALFWTGWLKKQFRTLRRAIAAIDRSVKYSSLGLILTIVTSTLIFRLGLQTGWAEGLYQTVSIVATGGDLHGETVPPWAKVFISVLKISGAALLALFTAILTQYFIRAKLGGAFEARKVPEKGHIVVCGLGNVGFRCVEELVKLGHQVVAIENVNDNPFAETVRRLGSPVIIGDATVAAVLNLARVGTARAVIAATESELKNLEIGLLVREVSSTLRVVVRLTDPTFATAAREAAGIQHAVSVPSLAAPAFVAALYGDLVQSLITVGYRTLCIVDVTVQPDNPCLYEQSLKAAMIDYRFLPLGLSGMPPFAQEVPPSSYRLKAGDKLTIVAELPDLERLMRRDRAPAIHRVIVESFPLTARDIIGSMIRTRRGCEQTEAEDVIKNTPFELATGLTRGEATELVALLAREKVESRIDSMN